MTTCNICGARSDVLLSLSAVPPIQNRLFATAQQAMAFAQVQADFFLCGDCHHISVVKNQSVEFSKDYNNDQTGSAVAGAHLERVVADVEAEVSDRAAQIVEIGCGRGELLRLLQQRGYSSLIGYDPAAPDTLGGLISKQRWDEHARAADVFILRHTLEEFCDADEFVGQLSAAMNSAGRVYCEITDAERIVSERDLFSLYPEYSNFFSIFSLARLLKKYGLSITKVTSYFDGEWFGVWARKQPRALHQTAAVDLRSLLVQRIRELPRPVVLWGMGGRGENFLSMIGADRLLIPIVIDVNEAKQGLFVPPFGHEIMSPHVLQTVRPGTILAANRRYVKEIAAVEPGCPVIAIDDLLLPQ